MPRPTPSNPFVFVDKAGLRWMRGSNVSRDADPEDTHYMFPMFNADGTRSVVGDEKPSWFDVIEVELPDDEEELALIALRSKPKTLSENWVKDFFAAEAPSETNQLIPTAWVNRAIDRELTSVTNLSIDNEASPTETKMTTDNEANIATEANETEEEKARREQAELDAAYPTRLATQAEREEVYGVHSSKIRDPHDLWICTPHGIPLPVMSSTKRHAQLMAQKALASQSKRG